MISVQNKTAFITGSSRGIGQQVALGLAKLGCNIVVHGRSEQHCAEHSIYSNNTRLKPIVFLMNSPMKKATNR